jgi:membrane protein DedA with SNARE-associated domain
MHLLSQDQIFQFLSQLAYQPMLIFAVVSAMMILSGFGLPIPEEFTIISVGLLAYMGAHPEEFPPPFPGARGITGLEAAAFTFISVFLADLMIFFIGRTFGRKITARPTFQRFFSGRIMERVNNFVKRYGIYSAFIFRFTPGLRFPAHIMLGMSQFPAWQFAVVDGLAAMISVPTQILLIYHYGRPILTTLSQFKIYIGGALLILGLIFFIRKLWKAYANRPSFR